MPVSLSIKNVPDEMVRRLKEWAARHHRSLHGELMAILEEAVGAARPLTRTRSSPGSDSSACRPRAMLSP